jgi:hypothetical protein
MFVSLKNKKVRHTSKFKQIGLILFISFLKKDSLSIDKGLEMYWWGFGRFFYRKVFNLVIFAGGIM